MGLDDSVTLKVPVHASDQNLKASQAPISHSLPGRTGNWLGWGADVYNTHWAGSDGILNSSNIGSLVPVCKQSYDVGVSAAPLVNDGIAYYPTWTGLLVALEYTTCRVVWTTNLTDVILTYKPLSEEQEGLVGPVSRTTPVIDDDGEVLYVGTLAHALLLAIDISTGKVIDTVQIDPHPFAILTQSPTFYDGHLFIGTSSAEEGAPEAIPNYQCCTFIGSMNAAALKHSQLHLLWTQPMAGSNFSGAAIWGSQPAIDPVRSQVFIATGNIYSLPANFQACQNQTANITVIQQGLTSDPCLPRNVYQESVVSLDLATGRINWVRQLSALDAWNSACASALLALPIPGAAAACPSTPGQDADFGMAPTFVPGSEYTPYELDIVVVGQKNGNLYALTAAAGTVLWAVSTGPDGVSGGLIWGVAVDDTAVYYTAVNMNRVNYTLSVGNGTVISNSAFGAASLKDGHILWQTAAPRNTTSLVPPSVANDVVFTGITGNWSEASVLPVGPGSFTHIDKHTGRILEEFPLGGYFEGAFAVVHEYVMFGTGYGGSTELQAGSFQVWKLGDDAG